MKLLRQTIRKLILEAIKADEVSGLAIVKLGASSFKTAAGKISGDKYFLIHPEFFQQIKIHHSRGRRGLTRLAADKYIFGTMTVSRVEVDKMGNCGGATGIVKLSAAQPGWGPTMYDIVMADNPGGIIPDRYSVSGHAYKVWKHYLYNRVDGVHAEPLDWKERPWTKDPSDDCTWGSSGDWGEPKDFTGRFDFEPVTWEELMTNINLGVSAKDYPETEYIKYSDWLDDPTNHVYHDAGGPITGGMVKSAIQKGDQFLQNLVAAGIDLPNSWWETLEYEFYRRQQKVRG